MAEEGDPAAVGATATVIATAAMAVVPMAVAGATVGATETGAAGRNPTAAAAATTAGASRIERRRAQPLRRAEGLRQW